MPKVVKVKAKVKATKVKAVKPTKVKFASLSAEARAASYRNRAVKAWKTRRAVRGK